MANLRYQMKQNCMDHPFRDGGGKQIQDKDTQRTYRRGINGFCDWIQETYSINNWKQLEAAGGAKKFVQEYEKKLESDGKSVSTIHTYLAPICKGLGLHLGEIEKPKRIADEMTRSRSAQNNQQGQIEQINPKYKRLVEFQKMVGIRRAELKKLKINSFRRDESGYPCVVVERGKGGKAQMQRILPEDIHKMKNFLKSVLDMVAGSELPRNKIALFTAGEMNNKIDLHGIRADQARRAYDYYWGKCETVAGKEKLQDELVKRWNACHGAAEQIEKQDGKYFSPSKSGKRFINEFAHNGKYELRGANRERCFRQGRPLAYDRTALLAVSVFHLSHWRNDVTVKHYML